MEYTHNGLHTKAEAIKWINRNYAGGMGWFLCVDVVLPIAGKDRHFRDSCIIKMSAAKIKEFIQDRSDVLEGRGARIRIRMTERCVFVGGSI